MLCHRKARFYYFFLLFYRTGSMIESSESDYLIIMVYWMQSQKDT